MSLLLSITALVAVVFGTAACASPSTVLPTAVQSLVETARKSVDSVAQIAGTTSAAQAPAPAATPLPLAVEDALSVVAAQEQVLTSIYERVLPSVVHIQVTQEVDPADMLEDFDFNLPDLPNMPDLPFGHPETPDSPSEPFYGQGEGSGFVWDTEGHIVTNSHVVENATKVRVIFADGVSAEAEVLGADPGSDLAVIKVDASATALAPVQLGDSNALKVGQMAVAIGNPYGLENTMTYGILSALGRTISSGTSAFSIPEVIQTDAPINPGNSGGPLLDREGRVIGINTQIVSGTGSNAGIGFAVPINIAKRVAPALIEKGSYDYAWLGISGQTLSPEVASVMDLPEDTKGALVMEVIKDGPADQAGLRGSDDKLTRAGVEYPLGGDVIISLDGQPVTGMDDLISYLAGSLQPGDTVQLEVIRSDGASATIEVTLGTRPSSQELEQQMQPEETPEQP
jgi:2-alkenal reductase